MRKRVWTTQPPAGTPIDWDSPLSQGLVDVIEFYGTPRSKLLRTTATIFGSSQKFGVPHAGNVSFDTSASYAGVTFIRADQAYVPATQTHIAVAQFNSYSGNYAGVFGTADEGGANNSFALQWQSANSYYCYGTNAATELLTVPIPMNAPTVVGLSGSPTQTAEIYVDGVSQGTWSQNFPRSALSGGRLTLFGERGASASYATEGFYALHLFYSTYLRQPAHAQVARNPWQIYYRRQRTYSIPPSSGTVYSNTLTEAGTAADSIAATATFPNAVTESGSAADAFASTATFAATLSEAGSAADALVAALAAQASLTESGTAADALSAAFTAVAAIAEAASALDAYTTALTAVNALTEAATAADSVSTGSVYLETLSEAGTAADALSAAVALQSALSETGAAADSLASVWQTFATLLEAATAADSVTNGQAYVEAITESGTAADALAAAMGAVAALAEAAAAADALQSSATLQSAISESSAAVDALATRVAFAGLALLEAGAAADVVVGVVAGAGQFSTDPRFVAALGGRTFTMPAIGRSFIVKSMGRTFTVSTNS